MPLVRALVNAGHDVVALTRSPGKQEMLRTLGAVPAVADALDPVALSTALRAARPTHVIHQLTALPRRGVRRARELELTNRLRIDGTRNLLDAAMSAGARRFIGGSFALLKRMPDTPAVMQDAVAAAESMETQIIEATRSGKIDGIVLRYGAFYGADNPMTQHMLAMIRRRLVPVVRNDGSLLPCIHLDDAVSATVAALDHGLPGEAYDIVDDQPLSMSDVVRLTAECAGAPAPFAVPGWLPRLLSPYMAAVTLLRLPLSNAAARHALHWRPAYPTLRDGLAATLRAAA